MLGPVWKSARKAGRTQEAKGYARTTGVGAGGVVRVMMMMIVASVVQCNMTTRSPRLLRVLFLRIFA